MMRCDQFSISPRDRRQRQPSSDPQRDQHRVGSVTDDRRRRAIASHGEVRADPKESPTPVRQRVAGKAALDWRDVAQRNRLAMLGSIQAVQAPYYGDVSYGRHRRTCPHCCSGADYLPRMPLFSSDDVKRQVGFDVTELIIAQLLYLEFDNPEKPIYFYINSTVLLGTPAMRSATKPKPSRSATRCATSSHGSHHLYRSGDGYGSDDSLGCTPGNRASLPHATIVLNQPALVPKAKPRISNPRQRSAGQQAHDAGNLCPQHRSRSRTAGSRHRSHALHDPAQPWSMA